MEKGERHKFLFVIKPVNLGQDELDTWDGTASVLKKAIEKQNNSTKDLVKTKVQTLTADVVDCQKMMISLDERIGEIYGATQH